MKPLSLELSCQYHGFRNRVGQSFEYLGSTTAAASKAWTPVSNYRGNREGTAIQPTIKRLHPSPQLDVDRRFIPDLPSLTAASIKTWPLVFVVMRLLQIADARSEYPLVRA